MAGEDKTVDFVNAVDSGNNGFVKARMKYFAVDDGVMLSSNFTGWISLEQVVGELSETTTVQSSVPQGSEIGPLLFLLFVNDLAAILDAQTLHFTDNVKAASCRAQKNMLLGASFYRMGLVGEVGPAGQPFQLTI